MGTWSEMVVERETDLFVCETDAFFWEVESKMNVKPTQYVKPPIYV